MKSILVLVTSSPTSSANVLSALMFCRAACEAGHKLSVFFYGEGVHSVNSFISPPGDELNVVQQWQALAENYQAELIVCNTAASKRGLLSEDEAPVQNAFNIHIPFIAGGLAEFASKSQSATRVVQF